MLTAGTGCPRCSRARDAIRPADTGRWAASVAPAASKISRDSRENSLRWRRNGAAKRGARRDARRPDDVQLYVIMLLLLTVDDDTVVLHPCCC